MFDAACFPESHLPAVRLPESFRGGCSFGVRAIPIDVITHINQDRGTLPRGSFGYASLYGFESDQTSPKNHILSTPSIGMRIKSPFLPLRQMSIILYEDYRKRTFVQKRKSRHARRAGFDYSLKMNNRPDY
ncbi:hypothetical protein SMB34_00750 [Thalassospira permensis NBRC 106175]|uniref:Uncharacterized protein n=1 Tax=Thalassospira permensis NBRC 106175 TaxID=1353532 RepID=A0ABR4TTW5_9PROT|nr:hypothetical protein SMB34_00750 [Thalassospira permensis NBRC 106175]